MIAPFAFALYPVEGPIASARRHRALRWSELARIGIPSLSLNEEWARTGAQYPRQHAAISSHPNYRVDVRNASHLSFSTNCTSREVLFAIGLISASQIASTRAQPWCTTDTPQFEVARLVAKYQIAFLKTHLQHETGYQQILTPGWALTVEDEIEFFVTEGDGNPAGADCADCFRYFTDQPGSDTEVAQRDDAFAAGTMESLPADD